MSAIKRSLLMYLSADKALGAFGGGLAAASLGFGVYMNVHGPAASFGHSHDFTVFAQLSSPRPTRPVVAPPASVSAPIPSDALDMTATASIGKLSRVAAPTGEADPDADARIISSVTLQTASDGAATILVGGRTQTVHIGDTLPDAGKIIEIRPGPRPTVKTSLGLILAAPVE